MSDLTPLDRAFIEMSQDENAENLRMRFFERLADCELFLVLTDEPKGTTIEPAVFPVDDANYVLVFDREERLSEFMQTTSPYTAMSGRSLVSMLRDNKLGIGLNLGDAPSSYLIPFQAVDWLADIVSETPEQHDRQIESLTAPAGVPPSFLTALDQKLAASEGLAKGAYLAGANYTGGQVGHVLAFVDAIDGSEQALANAVSEVLVFSGLDAAEIDVGFFKSHEAICASFAKVGLRFDLPARAATQQPSAPGSDPDRPPRLR